MINPLHSLPGGALRAGFLLTAVALILLFLTPPVWPGQNLTVLTEEVRPFAYHEDGRLTGYSVEVVSEIMRRLGVDLPIQVQPWARIFKTAQARPGVVLFSAARTPEREALFHWVGPLTTFSWCFYARRGSGLSVVSLDDARKVGRIGVYRNDVRHQYLESQGFTNLDVADNNELNVRKLMADRIDLVALGGEGVGYLLDAAGVSRDSVEPHFCFRQADLYIAFSLGTDPAVVAGWRQVFSNLEKEGLLEGYRERWIR